ncbi:MAG TPA: TIGR00268 family protein, partial [Clostridiaceae bacterium]|nr:TIGR00268 family protein [Clostridiaceae bacterium]
MMNIDCAIPKTLRDELMSVDKAALAFSGGVDSAYLLYATSTLGLNVRPYFYKGPFQPRFELMDARQLAADLGVELKVIEGSPLADKRIQANL